MEKSIFDIITKAKEILKTLRLSNATIRAYQERSFSPLIKAYEEKGCNIFQPEIMKQQLNEAEEQFQNHTISRKSLNFKRRGIYILNEIYETGTFEWKIFLPQKTTALPSYFTEILKNFIESLSINKNSLRSINSIVSRFFVFLKKRNIKDLNDITAEDIRDFLSVMHETRVGSMDEVVLTMKKLFQFLSQKGYKTDNYWLILASPRSREHKVKPAMQHNEIILIINQIERKEAPGKRDFAILSLAVTTGLRAGDIASLTLTDIHWKELELHVLQGKTNKIVVLPLQPPVRDALADYILNERPKSTCKNVFLRSFAPYDAFKDGVSVACVFRKYLRKAGISHIVNDGKTFHGIRRAVGTSMVEKGIPVTTVSQVLGHQTIRPTIQYISLDLHGLKKCALSMDSLGGTHEIL
ncbi:tyrosine-type recombinase/integrase [Succinivibrio dextrinosolvens]|uniref:tyrosine-type recombinase/integrase n=1 Tax=Succinivibrio dextrinosolvens TaxID=83771 RepID=UPI00068D477D|nr:tyrosine-type recombinase/integrase [Succinivibrio dextrinosolvens]